MSEDVQNKGSQIVPGGVPTPEPGPVPESAPKKQPPRYWIRLSVFLVPLILSELMFWRAGRLWEIIIFPIAWVGFFYFQMKRGGWNVFRP